MSSKSVHNCKSWQIPIDYAKKRLNIFCSKTFENIWKSKAARFLRFLRHSWKNYFFNQSWKVEESGIIIDLHLQTHRHIIGLRSLSDNQLAQLFEIIIQALLKPISVCHHLDLPALSLGYCSTLFTFKLNWLDFVLY